MVDLLRLVDVLEELRLHVLAPRAAPLAAALAHQPEAGVGDDALDDSWRDVRQLPAQLLPQLRGQREFRHFVVMHELSKIERSFYFILRGVGGKNVSFYLVFFIFNYFVVMHELKIEQKYGGNRCSLFYWMGISEDEVSLYFSSAIMQINAWK
jgi:hypothetical protein